MQNLRNLLYCLKLLIVSSITVVGGGYFVCLIGQTLLYFYSKLSDKRL